MRPLVVCAVAALVLAATAQGQGRTPGLDAPLPPGMRPLIIHIPENPPSSQRPIALLSGAQLGRFRVAQHMHEMRDLDGARAALLDLDREAPHHPLILTELGQVYLDAKDYASAERLGRTERTATKDSLLLGRELSLAYERLAKPREGAQVALEVWAAAPSEADWAGATVQRLGTADNRGVREAMRRAAEHFPERADLRLGWARLEWQSGETSAPFRILTAGERPDQKPPLRIQFADQLLGSGLSRDTTGAVESLLSLVADTSAARADRMSSARRAWNLTSLHGNTAEVAPRLHTALADVPPGEWDAELVVGLARGLRSAGRTAEARKLLASREGDPALKGAVSLEKALADLRDGPPERALASLQAAASSPEGAYRYAEALFYSGLTDSALVLYQKIVQSPSAPYTGAAFERIYLIEDADPRTALPAFGRMAYEDWRGNSAGAGRLADSLYHAVPMGPTWAVAALTLSDRREAAGDLHGALEPALAIADSLPGDRLAPRARQRAGDLYLKLKDSKMALAQYEECLVRYPKAWNAAEVRRRAEQLRREVRF